MKTLGVIRKDIKQIRKVKPSPQGLAFKISQGCLADLLFIFFLIFPLYASEPAWDNFSNEQIVEAIGKAENSIKYPYGIKSIDTKGNKEYARKICLNSVKNGRARWIKAGRPQDLIIFIGLRYCPPKTHRLNSNWVRNVKYWLKKCD